MTEITFNDVSKLNDFKYYEVLYKNNALNYGAKKALEYIYRLRDEDSFDLPIDRKLALIELMQDLDKEGLYDKLICFFPYFGINAGYNLIDSYYDATLIPRYVSNIFIDENGLIPKLGVLKIEKLLLNNIPYRDDGQPKVAFGHLYDNIYNGGSNYSDWNSYSRTHIVIKFSDNSTNKAVVRIGNEELFTSQDIPKDSHYYMAQRDGDEIKVFTKHGISGTITQSGMERFNLKKYNSRPVSISNQDTEGTRKKASFIIKALTDEQERVFYNLLTTYHTKIK